MGLADDVAAPAGAVPERPEARRPREGSQDSMEGSRHSHRSRTSDRSDHFPTGRMSVDLARPAAAHEVGGKRERGEEASATAEGDRERLLRRTTSSGRRVSLDLGLVGPPRQVRRIGRSSLTEEAVGCDRTQPTYWSDFAART